MRFSRVYVRAVLSLAGVTLACGGGESPTGPQTSGAVLATVPLPFPGANPWGVRAQGDRFLVTNSLGGFVAGRGSALDFSTVRPVAGTTVDVELNAAATRAYVAAGLTPAGDPGIAVVDFQTGEVLDIIPVPGVGDLFAVALSPDESHLYVGTLTGVVLLDLTTGVPTRLPGIPGPVTLFSRHPSLPRLYGNAAQSSVAEIDLTSGTLLRTFLGPGTGLIQGTAIAPDGSRLYAAEQYGDLITWDLATADAGPHLTAGGGFGLAVSPNGHLLYVGRDSTVLIVDSRTLSVLDTVIVHGGVRGVAVRPDGVVLAANVGGWVDFIR